MWLRLIYILNYLFLGENCHAKPEEKAIVTVWARSIADDRRNDYGTTLLCESAANPEVLYKILFNF